MSSRILPRILDTAIALFADYGYSGVTTRDIARKARVTEGSIYRLFSSKDRLFESSLEKVIGHLLDPAHFLLLLFENRQKHEFSAAIAGPVRQWYSSLTQQSARLLVYALLSKNDKWRQAAQAPLEKIIEILAGSMEREASKANLSRLNANTVARSLIFALFQLKVVSPGSRSTREESEQVEGMLQHWLNGLATVM
jgi:AcrR family transcriptional regulator